MVDKGQNDWARNFRNRANIPFYAFCPLSRKRQVKKLFGETD